MRLTFTILLLITLICPVMAVNITVKAENGVVGKPTNFTITVNAKTELRRIPVDVVLVMDCSGSMVRWGNIITKPKFVELKRHYTKIGEFTINSTSDVEVMLQKPLDIYTNRDWFMAYIVNEETHEVFPAKRGWSVVRWFNIPPGRYDVYARVGCCSGSSRIFCVELPPERLELAKSAAKEFVDLLGEDDRVAVVEFTSMYGDWWDYTRVLVHLTNDKSDVKSAIDSLTALGGTPMGYGLQLAVDELNSSGRENASRVIILLSDGWWNEGPDPMDVAREATALGYRIYTIGYGGADEDTLKAIAEKTGGRYYFAANESDLRSIYAKIAREIECVGRDAVLKIRLENVTFLKSVPSCRVEGNTLVWDIGDLKPEVLNFSVTVESSREGKFKVAEGWLNYTDPNGSEISKGFEVTMDFVNHPPSIEVSGNTEVYEMEWLDLIIRAEDPDGHRVDLSYTAPIAGIFRRINATTWELKWMPSSSFVEGGTRTFNITFTAKDEYGKIAKKNVTITVYDRKKWLTVWTDKDSLVVEEGKFASVLIHVNSSSRYTMSFDVIGANPGSYVAWLEYGDGGMVFGFMPQYNFTSGGNKTVEVVFTANNLDGLTARAHINVTVENVNVSTFAWVNVTPSKRGIHYVGEPLRVRMVFVNATKGWVTVNGVEIWRCNLHPPEDAETTMFIPNTAGTYEIEVWAMNGTNTTLTKIPPISVYIRPVT